MLRLSLALGDSTCWYFVQGEPPNLIEIMCVKFSHIILYGLLIPSVINNRMNVIKEDVNIKNVERI